MTFIQFHEILKKASLVAIGKTDHFFKDKKTDDFRYNVFIDVLNKKSVIDQVQKGREKSEILKLDLNSLEVYELLNKKGKFPEKLRINVLKSSRLTTTFNLMCSEIYSDNDIEFYYSE